MHITRTMMDKAVQKNIISAEQAEELLAFFQQSSEKGPGFNLTTVLYYFGGLLAIGAMNLFMNLGWDLYGGWCIVFLSLCYALIGLYLTHRFANKGYAIPASLCATFVIFLTPLAIYGFQRAMGWWPDDTVYRQYSYFIKWHWIYMEVGTLIVGIILTAIYRYPFMVMPIGLTLWYMSMDITSMINGGEFNPDLGAKVSMYFGMVTLLIAFIIDLRQKTNVDYAFWLYLFGMMAFWGGLTAQHSDSELTKFFYLCINLVLILIGIILNRKVFVLFGGMGSAIYVGHLAYQVFQNSFWFPIILTLIGLGIIYLGIIWQKNEALLTSHMRCVLPKRLQELLNRREG